MNNYAPAFGNDSGYARGAAKVVTQLPNATFSVLITQHCWPGVYNMSCYTGIGLLICRAAELRRLCPERVPTSIRLLVGCVEILSGT